MALIREQGVARFFSMGIERLMGRSGDIGAFLKIWRIIAIELYRNARMRAFFEQTMMEGPYTYWEGIFSRMMAEGLIPPGDARLLSEELFSYSLFIFFEAFILKYEEDPLYFPTCLSARMERHISFILGVQEHSKG